MSANLAASYLEFAEPVHGAQVFHALVGKRAAQHKPVQLTQLGSLFDSFVLNGRCVDVQSFQFVQLSEVLEAAPGDVLALGYINGLNIRQMLERFKILIGYWATNEVDDRHSIEVFRRRHLPQPSRTRRRGVTKVRACYAALIIKDYAAFQRTNSVDRGFLLMRLIYNETQPNAYQSQQQQEQPQANLKPTRPS